MLALRTIAGMDNNFILHIFCSNKYLVLFADVSTSILCAMILIDAPMTGVTKRRDVCSPPLNHVTTIHALTHLATMVIYAPRIFAPPMVACMLFSSFFSYSFTC